MVSKTEISWPVGDVPATSEMAWPICSVQNNRRAATLHDGTLPRVQRAVSTTVNRANDQSVVAALTQR